MNHERRARTSREAESTRESEHGTPPILARLGSLLGALGSLLKRRARKAPVPGPAPDAPRRRHFPELTLPKSARARGAFGEALAERCLCSAGLVVLDRNRRVGPDELDRVMRDGDSLVVVEVKTRCGLRGGRPAESVGARKRERLRRALARLVESSPTEPRRRIDLVEVFPAEPPEVGLWLVWTPHAVPVESER